MQIHEITTAPLTEAIGSNLAQKAVSAAGALGSKVASAKGLGQRFAQPFQQARQAYTQAQVGAKATGIAGKAQSAWQTYVQNLQATQQATPQVLEQSLRAFIQKNLLGDLKYQYNNLTNVDQIETVLKQIIDPANAQRQSDLWTQLVRTIGVSQAGGQAPAGVAPGPGGKKGKQQPGGGGLVPSPTAMAKELQSKLGINPAIYKGLGDSVKIYANSANAGSTGNPAIDAFLRSLNFTVQ